MHVRRDMLFLVMGAFPNILRIILMHGFDKVKMTYRTVNVIHFVMNGNDVTHHFRAETAKSAVSRCKTRDFHANT